MYQQATTRLAAWAGAIVLALGVASCSSDDGADPLSTLTDPPATSTAPPTTPATTTTTTTAVAPTEPPATTAPPTTVSAPQTETVVTLSNSTAPGPTEVFEAVRVTAEREAELLYEPTAPDLDSQLGEVAEAGSPYESAVRSRLSQLQADGVKFSTSQPSNNQLLIEEVLNDEGEEVTVQICEISNDRIVSAADPSVVVDDYWDGRLHVTRSALLMRRTDGGDWLRVAIVGDVEAFQGVETCPLDS